MANDKDDRSFAEKVEDTITMGTSRMNRERKKKGLPSLEEEASKNAPSLFDSTPRYKEHR